MVAVQLPVGPSAEPAEHELAHGGKNVATTVLNQELFAKMKEYVR